MQIERKWVSQVLTYVVTVLVSFSMVFSGIPVAAFAEVISLGDSGNKEASSSSESNNESYGVSNDAVSDDIVIESEDDVPTQWKVKFDANGGTGGFLNSAGSNWSNTDSGMIVNFTNVVLPSGCSNLFAGQQMHKVIFTNADFSHVVNMSGMFAGSQLRELSFAGANMPLVTNMSSLCASCSKLETVNLTGMIAPSLITMYGVFCR